jgi:hypothetical protein
LRRASPASHKIDELRCREISLPDPVRPAPTRKTEIREILVDGLLMPEGKGRYYINPYVGA